MKYLKIQAPVTCLALLLMLCSPFHASANDKVRLQLKWPHHYLFAGYYAAKEKGYYKAAGLDVELLPNKPGEDPVQKVLDGNAEFGVGTSDLLLRREQGAPVVVLAVILQQSGRDLTGRRIQVEHKNGASPDKINPLAQSFRAEDLAAGTIDSVCTNDEDEPSARNTSTSGNGVSAAASPGADFYGDNLFTTESQIKLKPEMVRAFREASLKGWEYAMMHPEEMVQLIHARYSQRYSIEHLRFEARQIEPLLQTQFVEIGHINPNRWRRMAEVYIGLGMMRPDFDFNGFLYEPMPSPTDLKWFYGGFITVLLLLVAAVLVALRFSRLSTTLKNTIADYKRVGNALQESEALYRSILNASPDGISIVGLEGHIEMISPAGVAMFGYECEEELLGVEVNSLISPEDRDRFVSSVKGSSPKVGEYRALKKDGSTIEIETNGRFILNAEGKQKNIVCVVRDITERKQAGHSCRAAMGEMISAIAHQWRQPLATLGMIVQRTHAVGTMQGLTKDSLDEFKNSAMRQIRYMSDTIEEFRNFSNPEKQKELFLPLSCINDAVSLFEHQLISSNIAVDVHCQGCEEQLVNGFPKEFKQVILNLIGNARDAIMESRTINGEPEAGRINVNMSVNRDNAMTIDITDNGCGVAPDIAQRILEPYFTTKEESGGTGLGLYMSRMIVEESLGGRFRQIPCHEGATFRIELLLEKTI